MANSGACKARATRMLTMAVLDVLQTKRKWRILVVQQGAYEGAGRGSGPGCPGQATDPGASTRAKDTGKAHAASAGAAHWH